MNFEWGHSGRYNDYGNYIRKIFNGKVQKISVNAGFTCPNRDGTKGTGGCTFCNNDTFKPEYCQANISITEQIKKGITFFNKQHPETKYIAYFQTYTNTYSELPHLIASYEEALSYPDVEGLIIGTRPDCLPKQLLDYLEKLSTKTYLVVELGIESTNDKTLKIINRKHNFETSRNAILKLEQRNIKTGIHLILGLPNETHKQMLAHTVILSQLPINFMKVHQLQYVKNSQLGNDFRKNPLKYKVFDIDEYIDLVVDFMELTAPSIVLERLASQTPYNLLLAPAWKIKNFEFMHKIEKRLIERNTWQGKKFKTPISFL
ncbi:MAG: TIGR01212 family radical SAM protein [Lactococcus lactis]|jgi:radical SAM protein (TIGR01212 family)|nr:TIGR01212 family radical SAM protein [Lactococcus lactis]